MNSNKNLIFTLAVLAVIIISFIDIITPPQYILSVFYIAPILIVTFTFGPRIIAFMTLLVIIVSSATVYESDHFSLGVIMFELIGYLIIGSLAIRISIEKQKYEDIVNQLQLFMHMVSHDLTQPITATYLYAQILKKNPDNRVKQSSQKIIESLNDMQMLIEDLKDIAQARSGKFKINPKKMDLCKIIKLAAKQYQKNTKTHTIVLKLPKKIIGSWDADRLHQVINNLLSNAIKYSPRGKVIITALENPGMYVISIQDFGNGISKNDQDIIFQPFRRVGKDKAIKGSGLGLYISKLIIESHNGKLWVSSNKGKGSTFFIELPAAKS